MIGKVARFGSSFLGAMQYCYYETRANHSLDRTRIRGELLFVQHIGVTVVEDARLRVETRQRLNLEQMATAMQSVASLNERLRKPVWHQSFSFPPGECPSADIMVKICQSFARTFGMENNPMVAFRHRDRGHEHFHIIASRVDKEGINSAQVSFNFREVGRFCRAMEARHGLTPGVPMVLEKRREQPHKAAEAVAQHQANKPVAAPTAKQETRKPARNRHSL